MNVAWKFIAVLALLFSLAALTLQILQIQGEDKSNAIRQQVELAMQTRERKLLDQFGPMVEELRDFRHLSGKPVQSLEDVGQAIVDLIANTPTAPQVQPTVRP
jgi:hypothetical protein